MQVLGDNVAARLQADADQRHARQPVPGHAGHYFEARRRAGHRLVRLPAGRPRRPQVLHAARAARPLGPARAEPELDRRLHAARTRRSTKHYFAGGFSTLRGFDFRGASPVRQQRAGGRRVPVAQQRCSTCSRSRPTTCCTAWCSATSARSKQNVTIKDFRVAPGRRLADHGAGDGPGADRARLRLGGQPRRLRRPRRSSASAWASRGRLRQAARLASALMRRRWVRGRRSLAVLRRQGQSDSGHHFDG